ncbi:ScbR family autoregulator-binding transcription factor [Leifsonia sp. NPDC080035]|uniref:ScbR family autoregulator-binding transcription factor n=1 Tax=Leifsonia sp. NPDC080035 TaxID=3143936 RepID=A0AAU7GDU3_9MICO
MPRQERAERSRARILDAAAEEFDSHGFSGARLERIVERTGLTKGAVYFHFRSKLDLAGALVAEDHVDWPGIVESVEASGLRGLAAVTELTSRVATIFVEDVRVRAALKLSQTVLPPEPGADPYAQWAGIVAGYLRQAAEDGELHSAADPQDIAAVAVQGFFGAYMIADERGGLDGLQADVDRLWRVILPVAR